jgi:hypothetical protein
MRMLLVTVAARLLGMGRRSEVGMSSSDVSSEGGVGAPFWVVEWLSSTKSRSQFGSRRTSSGIGSRPSGRGYCSRRRCRSVADQGTKDPSILESVRFTLLAISDFSSSFL